MIGLQAELWSETVKGGTMAEYYYLPMRVLMLCTGNSCRSQMAEGFLSFFDPNLEVFSAGTAPSDQVHPKAVEVKQHMHIGFDDPAEAKGTEEEIYAIFRRVRDEISDRMYAFYNKAIGL